MVKFDKNQAEHELKVLRLTHQFALRMASIISLSVVGTVLIGSVIAIKEITSVGLVIAACVVVGLGITTFFSTRSACL